MIENGRPEAPAAGKVLRMIIAYVLLLAAGFAALVKGADFFVAGSSALARRFRVPSLIIGLTIVAMGTSAPELAVSTAAAVQGANEIALSNVIGSNLFNLLMVLGICALLHPVPADRSVLVRDFPVAIAAALAVLAGSAGPALLAGSLSGMRPADAVGSVSRPLACLLLLGFALYLVFLILAARRHPQEEDAPGAFSPLRCALGILGGIALIVAGGEAVVASAKVIARAAGMSETLVGLTVVAIGTSLPELVTSVVAAGKGETGLAVGNVLGSNVINFLFVLGLSAAIHPIGVNLASVYDLVLLTAASALTFFFLYTVRRIDRWEGAVLVALYAANVVFAIVR